MSKELVEKKDRAFFEYDGPVPIPLIELPLENRTVPVGGNMGELRVTKSNGVCYRGKPQHPVHLYPGDLLSTEKLGRNLYYVIKVPLKGGYWRPH